MASNIKREGDEWTRLCTPFVPGFYKNDLPNYGPSCDPTVRQASDKFAPVTTIGGSNIVNALVGYSIYRHGEVR